MTRHAHEQSLPGTVAEIRASEPGPHVGAFFDVDGTLVAGFTAAAVTKAQTKSGMLSRTDMVKAVGPLLSFARGTMQFEDLLATTVRPMKGLPASEVDDLGRAVFAKKIVDLIYPEMRRLVRAHMEQGHTVVISSSAMTLQVEPVADFLQVAHVLCNRLVADAEGILTGELVQPVIWGPGKSHAVQKFAAEHDIDLAKSYFYADGDEDVALMYVIGKPRPTNPRALMASVARKRGWPVLDFSSRGAGGVVHLAKQAFGFGSLVSLAGVSAALGVARQDKRKGMNLLLRTFPDLFLKLNGVELHVTGRDNLEKARPAVFIFNHRTNADAFIAAQLLGHDFTGVAKKELEKDPFMGPVGKMMDVAFLDRENPESAVASMRQVEELTRKGLSVLVAPEGTRLDTTSVGPFKKGAFRMAMSAGLPIIPIIIRNAEDIAGLGSHTFNPGVVDVHVGDPIDTSSWTLPELDHHMAQVRQLYLDQLAAWPGRPAPMTDPAAHSGAPAPKAAKKAAKQAARKPTKKPATRASTPAVKAASSPAGTAAPKVPKKAAKRAPTNGAGATAQTSTRTAAPVRTPSRARTAALTPGVLGAAVDSSAVAASEVEPTQRSRTSSASRALAARQVTPRTRRGTGASTVELPASPSDTTEN